MADVNLPGMPPAGGPAPVPGGAPPMPMGGAKVGPVVQPQPNLGNQVQATAKIANALKELQDALPQIPMGSELHTTILDTVKKLSKVTQEAKPDPSMQLQELIRAARERSQGGPLAAAERMFPPGGGGAPPAMPVPPPPAAAAA